MAKVFGIVFASPQEAGPFRACLSALGIAFLPCDPSCFQERPSYRSCFKAALGDTAVVFTIAGIGREMARKVGRDLVEQCGVEWLVSAGVSGGLREGSRIGDLLQAATIVEDSGQQWQAVPLPTAHSPLSNSQSPISNPRRSAHTSKARGANPNDSPQHWGARGASAVLYCSSSILSTPAAKQKAGTEWQADAVDMESAGVAEAACEKGVPFSCIRALSDALEDSLPLDFTTFIDSSGRLRMGALAAWVALHPWLISPLLRLGRHTHQASTRLARYLCEVFQTSAIEFPAGARGIVTPSYGE